MPGQLFLSVPAAVIAAFTPGFFGSSQSAFDSRRGHIAPLRLQRRVETGCYPVPALPPTKFLLPTQLHDVARVIERAGLRREDFEWSDIEVAPKNHWESPRPALLLDHQRSDFFFRFDDDKGTCLFSPGYGTRSVRRKATPGSSGWDHQLRNVGEWISSLVRELAAPDIWSQSSDVNALMAAISSDQQPFAEEEKQRLFRDLDVIKQYLLEAENQRDQDASLAAQRQEFIEQQFAEIKDASGRMTRKDWILLLAGSIQNLGYQLAMTPEAVIALGKFAATTLHWLATGHPPLLS